MKNTAKNKNKFLDALYASLGIITRACKRSNISRTTYYKWLANDSKFKAAAEEVQETCIDMVESELLNRIQEGNVPATIFYLKCKGKKRGYIERQEITGANGKELPPIVVQQTNIKPPEVEEVRSSFKI